MSVLLLRLAGPLQSWGTTGTFQRRDTNREPTKSGIVGLLAAAQGRRRTENIEDLAALRFGVRIDQAGTIERDFQTIRTLEGASAAPLAYKYYLADAAFVAGVEGEEALLESLLGALRSPTFPLYLGRRSCPPAGHLALGIRPGNLEKVLQEEPWQASLWWRKKQAATVELPIMRDAGPQEQGDSLRDVPRSFNPERRLYSWRKVVQADHAIFQNPDSRLPALAEPDFFAALGA